MNRRLQLINWVKARHEGQLIKDTQLPYFDHLLAVANRVADSGEMTYEIGICHDLFEKTAVTAAELLNKLVDFGYHLSDAEHVSNCVTELTRHFTRADNPLPKNMRKVLENERLTSISADAQVVKYADLAYNAEWMMVHDRHHARDYLTGKIELISGMTDGHERLRLEVLTQLSQLLNQL